MRLQVFLSHSRVCSRRNALELVKAGRVSVNGRIITEPSYDVCGQDEKIYLDEKRITLRENDYIIFNKPKGVTTTLKDKHAKITVAELLPKRYRHLYPVGRLDKDSEGLLLFTNDGDLCFRLLHPGFKVRKIYYVRVHRPLTAVDAGRLEKGVLVEGRLCRADRVEEINGAFFKITLHEGRKRQIRLMCLSLGYRIKRLLRVQYGQIKLGGLKAGDWRVLSGKEARSLNVKG